MTALENKTSPNRKKNKKLTLKKSDFSGIIENDSKPIADNIKYIINIFLCPILSFIVQTIVPNTSKIDESKNTINGLVSNDTLILSETPILYLNPKLKLLKYKI